MTMKRVSTVVAVLGAGLLVTACDIEQPSAGCVVQDSQSWIARYDVVGGDETCARPPPAGERIGVFKYRDPNKEDSNVLALRPEGLASRGDRDDVSSQSQQTAVGHLGSEPDANDFCKAETLSEASVSAESTDKEDATQISYKFSNVEVYSAPRAPGTQLRADLTYVRDGCTKQIKVHAMWPAVGCTPGSSEPALNCGEGSHINPDMAVTCHPTLKYCVPAKDVPSFIN